MAEPQTHRAAIVIDWQPSASIGEPQAVRRLLETKAAVIVDVLDDWGVTEARGRVDDQFSDDTLCDCGDALSAKYGARCGNCQAAHEKAVISAARDVATEDWGDLDYVAQGRIEEVLLPLRGLLAGTRINAEGE